MGIFGKRMRIATKSIAVITIVVLLLLCNIFCDVVGQQQPQRLSQHNVYRNSTRRQNKQQEDIRIDCGNTRSSYTDSNGNKWLPDRNYTGGKVVRSYRRISNTADDWLYQTRREGKNIQYQIPVAPGEYEVRLLFAECRRFVRWFGGYRRKFNAILEKVQLEEIDLLALSHGQPRRAVQIVTESVLVEDGILTIELYGNPQVRSSTPVLSGIEIILSELHVVHAVPQGPYYGTIVEETNPTAMVPLIGETSHTHGFGLEIVNVQWTLAADRTLIGTALNVNSSFPVGNHTVSLTVQDSGNNTNTVNTTVIIRPFGFPVITQLLPNQGSIAGNDDIVITGGGFLYSAEQTTIVFGSMMVPTSNIIIRDSKTIQIKSPSTSISGPVMVQVITPVGDTNAMPFTYIGSVPIDWTSSTLSSLSIRGPAVGRFGPDQKLYVGTTKGQIYKITMDATFSNVVHFMATLVNEKQESM